MEAGLPALREQPSSLQKNIGLLKTEAYKLLWRAAKMAETPEILVSALSSIPMASISYFNEDIFPSRGFYYVSK